MDNKKEILVIFKTHLDIGFTDYAETVKDKYINQFIPNAIRVGNELKNTETPFVWTTGSWLIWEALKQDKDGSVAKAIEDGIICWHGLPCTTHTELMNAKMFEYGLSLSQKLDARFNKHTIAAKMTDVPGHTIAMIPYLKKAGIEFLHIGVNTATPLPPVPPVFKWKFGDDEITVMYQTGYGLPMEFDDFVIYFAHTEDNCGPQSGDEIIKLYDKIKKEYPNSVIKAATLNDAAMRVRELKNLPIVDKEIGDTWIHGVGTDPKKVGMYKEVLRYIDDNNIDTDKTDLSDNLLLVPEHTWGMNTNVYFKVYKDYELDEFAAYENDPDKLKVEKSWQEQRDFVTAGAKALNYDIKYEVREPSLDGFGETESEDAEFEISWELFDTDDYLRYMKVYLQFTPQNIGWACADYMKLGLPLYKGGVYTAKVLNTYTNGRTILYRLGFDGELSERYGLPYFWVEKTDNRYEIKWFNKGKLRLPHAIWLKFKGFDEKWEIDKLNHWIKAEDVIGSPLICATDYGVRNGEYEIESRDAALVAPFGRRLYDYDTNPSGQDLYFNLYNNVWNTNFPMWYGDDTKFEFIINKR